MISISPSGHVIRHTKRKARELNPHPVEREPRLAERPGQPYPATFHISVDRPGIEPGSPVRRTGVVPLDHQPVVSSGPDGSRTQPAPTLQGSVASWEHASPSSSEVRPGVEPGLPPYRGGVLPKHLQTIFISDPGWNRTSTFLVVTQASSPLDHGIVFLSVTEVGLEPTGTRLSTSPLCQFAYPVISGGSGSCTRLSRLMRPG